LDGINFIISWNNHGYFHAVDYKGGPGNLQGK
jgi:hypothetical protein